MAFPRNDAVNRVNLHSGIQALAQGGGAIFFLVFLLRSGISVSAALLAQAAILVGRFILRPLLLPLAKRYGLKPLLIFGTLATAVQYPLLPEVNGVGGILLVLCIVTSVGEVCYWLSYNTYYATVGDAEHLGHQLGIRGAAVAVAGVIAPLLGAWAILTAGPRWAFAAVGLIQTIAAAPLLGAPNIAVKQEAPGVLRAARQGVILVAVDGWIDSSYFFVWPIALFVSLSESIPAYGGAMALAGLVGAASGLLLGRHIDAGHGRWAVVIAYTLATLVVLLRAVSLRSPWLAVSANALSALVMPPLLPALGDCYLQSRETLTLYLPLPHGHRRRLGCGLLLRLLHRSGDLRVRRAAVACHPPSATWDRGSDGPALALLCPQLRSSDRMNSRNVTIVVRSSDRCKRGANSMSRDCQRVHSRGLTRRFAACRPNRQLRRLRRPMLPAPRRDPAGTAPSGPTKPSAPPRRAPVPRVRSAVDWRSPVP
jgi:MFS transporter, DHA1 family, inner membrane transport protein